MISRLVGSRPLLTSHSVRAGAQMMIRDKSALVGAIRQYFFMTRRVANGASIVDRTIPGKAFDVSQLPPKLQEELDHSKTASLLQHLTSLSAAPSSPSNALVLKPTSKWLVGWRCRQCSATWTSRVLERCDNRTSMHFDCPACASATTTSSSTRPPEALAESYPELAVDWDDAGNINPRFGIDEGVESISSLSPVRVWWNCQRCHRSWREAVFARVQRYKQQVLALTSAQRKAKQRVDGGACPRCDDLFPQNPSNIGARTYLSEHPYLMSEVILTSGQCPSSMRLTGEYKLRWRCSYCQDTYTAPLSDRAQRAVHCPACTGDAIVKPKASALPPVDAVATARPDVLSEVADRKYSPLALQYMTTTDPRYVRFVCRTCLEPYQMTMLTRCLFPAGHAGCPKCRFANLRSMREHNETGERSHSAAIASRKKFKSRNHLSIVKSKMDRLGSLLN